MTSVPSNYTEAETQLSLEVGAAVTEVLLSVNTAIARIDAAGVRMTQLSQAAPVGYLGLIQYIDAQAAAFPADTVWQNLKNRRLKIVADFTTVQTRITNLKAAIAAVGP